MEGEKTKSLRNLQEKMADLEPGSLRYRVLESAKSFKSSWIELGRSLYSVWKDKMYKEWGYGEFDIYVAREIGIRKQTAMKLLRSYYFLEKEEPAFLEKDNGSAQTIAKMPSYESIDLLRRAKNQKGLDRDDYDNLKKDIFEQGKDAREARQDLATLIRQRQELDPDEAYKERRIATVRRFLGTLKALKKELEIGKLLSPLLLKEASSLIAKLEAEIE